MDLKEKRKELGISQVEVARSMGVPLSTYILWERGVSTPNDENMIKVKRFLGIEPMKNQ